MYNLHGFSFIVKTKKCSAHNRLTAMYIQTII